METIGTVPNPKQTLKYPSGVRLRVHDGKARERDLASLQQDLFRMAALQVATQCGLHWGSTSSSCMANVHTIGNWILVKGFCAITIIKKPYDLP